MVKYRKKPVVIEAFKWTGDVNQTEDPKWIIEAIKKSDVWFNNAGTENVNMEIKTLEGNHIANRGDYIIQGIKGEIYPCKPDIFEKTYEKVESNGLTVNVNIKDTEDFEKLAKGITDLIKQIEMNDYKDSLRHPLKMNKAYIDLKELILKESTEEDKEIAKAYRIAKPVADACGVTDEELKEVLNKCKDGVIRT